MLDSQKLYEIYLLKLSYLTISPHSLEKQTPSVFFSYTWKYYFEPMYHSGILYLDTFLFVKICMKTMLPYGLTRKSRVLINFAQTLNL